LCFLILQETRTTPLRLNTLHSLHIFLTDALTFMSFPLKELFSLALAPEGNSAPGEVIRRQFHRHPITRKDLDKMHPHLAGNMSKHPVAIIELHPKHGVRQGLDDGSFYLNGLFFWHISPDAFYKGISLRHKDDRSIVADLSLPRQSSQY
jgi:hypothetical protein